MARSTWRTGLQGTVKWAKGDFPLPLDLPLAAGPEATSTGTKQEPAPPLKQKKAAGLSCEEGSGLSPLPLF